MNDITPERAAELTAQEEQKYKVVWQQPIYREQSPAWRCADEIAWLLGLVKAYNMPGKTVADYGCGTGRTARYIAECGHKVLAIDLVPNALEASALSVLSLSGAESVDFIVTPLHQMGPHCASDVAYCVDVMEHIPPELIDATLARMALRCAGKIYFRIARFPDHFGQTLGVGHLHLSLFEHGVWESYLQQHWHEVHTVQNGPDAYHGQPVSVFVVDRPKR